MSGTTRDRLTPIDGGVDQSVYYDARRGTYHTWCDGRDYEPASIALLEAVASVRDVDPAELEPLASRIDADALNAMVGHWGDNAVPGDDGAVQFAFAGCTVTIRADGEIVIVPGDDLEPSPGP